MESTTPAPTGGLAVSYSLSGTAGLEDSDFSISDGASLSGTGTVTILQGMTSARVDVDLSSDAVSESAETLTLTLTDGAAYDVDSTQNTYAVTIEDTTELTVSFATARTTVEEGDAAVMVTVNVTSPPSEDLVVSLRVSGGASVGTDYTLSGLTGAGATRMLTIPSGSDSTTFTVTPRTEDNAPVGAETAVFTLQSGMGYAVGTRSTHRLTIADDDYTVEFAEASSEVVEGAAADTEVHNIVVEVTPAVRTGGMVSVRVQANPAASGTTYSLGGTGVTGSGGSYTLALSAGATTGTLELGPVGNDEDGADLQVRLRVQAGSNYVLGGTNAHTVTIEDDDVPVVEPSITITAVNASVVEGTDATFTVEASSVAPTGGLTVNVSVTQSGSFLSGTPPLTVTIPMGMTTATLTVSTVDDGTDELDGTITATVATGMGYTVAVAPGNSASVTVTDDDDPVVRIAAGASSVGEGTSALFEVSASTVQASDLVVNVNVAETGGFAPPSETGAQTVTILSGESSVTLSIPTVDDRIDEVDGTIAVRVETGSGYRVAASPDNTASVTVTDNDEAGITVTPTSGLTTTESGGTATFTVVLDSQPTADVVIGVSSSDTSEGTVSTDMLTFTDGNWDEPQSVTVTGVDDGDDDGTVTYTIMLAAATSTDGNYSGVDPVDVSVSSTDDDAAPTSITLTVQPNTLSEGDSATDVTVTATFDGGTTVSAATTVTLSLGGGAVSGTDYSATAPTITIAAEAATGTATLRITPTDDDVVEGDENIVVSGTATGGFSGTVNSVTVTLTDNDVADTTPPMFVSAVINGNMLVLTYDEALDEDSVPDKSAFTLGGTLATVSMVAVSGMTVTLTLSAPVTSGDVVTVSYTADATPLQDAVGNDAANLATQVVTNNTPPPAPTAVTVSSNLAGTLTIFWTAPSPAPAGGYHVQYRLGSSPWRLNVTAAGPYVTFGRLPAGMYTARVRSVATDTSITSAWVEADSPVEVGLYTVDIDDDITVDRGDRVVIGCANPPTCSTFNLDIEYPAGMRVMEDAGLVLTVTDLPDHGSLADVDGNRLEAVGAEVGWAEALRGEGFYVHNTADSVDADAVADSFMFSLPDGTTHTVNIAIQQPPMVVDMPSMPGPYTAGTAATFDVASDFTDLNGDTLTYALGTVTPASAAITLSGSSTVSISTAATANTYSIPVTAEDDGGLSVTHVYTVVVNAATSANNAPTVVMNPSAPGPYTAGLAGTFNVANDFMDADSSDTLSYALGTVTGPQPGAVTLNVSMVTVAATVTPGRYRIPVVATDDGTPPLSVSHTYEVSVDVGRPTAVTVASNAAGALEVSWTTPSQLPGGGYYVQYRRGTTGAWAPRLPGENVAMNASSHTFTGLGAEGSVSMYTARVRSAATDTSITSDWVVAASAMQVELYTVTISDIVVNRDDNVPILCIDGVTICSMSNLDIEYPAGTRVNSAQLTITEIPDHGSLFGAASIFQVFYLGVGDTTRTSYILDYVHNVDSNSGRPIPFGDPDALTDSFTFFLDDGATHTVDIAINQPPAVVSSSSTPGPFTAGTATTFDVANDFTDPNSDTLTYSLGTLAGPVTGAVSIRGSIVTIGTTATVGTYTIPVEAADGGGLSVTHTYVVMVNAPTDTTVPVLSTATVNGNMLVLTYGEALDTASEPAGTDFTIEGVTGATVSTVAVSGMTVTLTLSVTASPGDTVTVSYTAGTNPLQDAVGNDAANLATQAVTNNTPPPVPTAVTVASNLAGALAVSWTAPDPAPAGGYHVQYRLGSGTWMPADPRQTEAMNASSHTFTGLSTAGMYTARVRSVATDTSVTSAWVEAGSPVEVGLLYTVDIDDDITVDRGEFVELGCTDPPTCSTFNLDIEYPAGTRVMDADGLALTVTDLPDHGRLRIVDLLIGGVTVSAWVYQHSDADSADALTDSFMFSLADGTTHTVNIAIQQPPMVVDIPSMPGPYTAGTAATFDVASDFTDLNGDTLTYNLGTVDPPSAAITSMGSTVSISTAAAANTYSIPVTAEDDGGLSVTHVYTVVVNAATSANNAPTVVMNPSMPGPYTAGTTSTFDIVSDFTDADSSDTLSYMLGTVTGSTGSLPGAVSIDDASGMVTVAATATPGTYRIPVVVTDDGTPPLSVSHTYEVNVEVAPPTAVTVASDAAGDLAVSWTAPSQLPGGGYHIQYRRGDAGAWLPILLVESVAMDDNSYTVTGFGAEGSASMYTARVRSVATDTSITSDWVEAASATQVELYTVTISDIAVNRNGDVSLGCTNAPACSMFNLDIEYPAGTRATSARGTLTQASTHGSVSGGSGNNLPVGSAIPWVSAQMGGDWAYAHNFDLDTAMRPFPGGDPDALTDSFMFLLDDGATHTVNIAINQPPAVVGAPSMPGPFTAGTEATFDVSNDFTDPNSDTLTYALGTVSPTTTAVTISDDGTVTIGTVATAGTYTIPVEAEDGGGLSVTHTYMVMVNAADTTAPVLSTVTVNGNTLVLTYGEALDTASEPAGTDFEVFSVERFTGIVTGATVSTVAISGMTVTLTLSEAVRSGDVVRLSYVAGTTPLQDAAGNAAVNLSRRAVTNNTPAPPVPTAVMSSADAPGALVVSWTAPSSAPTGGYQVQYSNDGGNNWLPAAPGQAVVAGTTTHTFTNLAAGMYDARVRSVVGRDTSAWVETDSPVTVAAPDTTPPTLSTAEVNGDMLVLTYDEALDTASVPAGGDFTIGGVPSVSVNTVAISGMTVTLTLSAAVTSGDTVTVSYAVPGMNPLQDAAGNNAAGLTAQAVTNNTPAPTLPAVSISTVNASVAEGTDATFTVTATTAPTSALTVNVNVVDSGTFATASETGTQTVTIPMGMITATLTVSTVDDGTDELDGTITATVATGMGYTVAVAPGNSAMVTVTDDDEPEVSISAVNASVAEGADATFTVTATTAPASALTVNVNVVDNGAFASSSDTGARTVTIPIGMTTATLTVSTVDDSTDEANGTITATVTIGAGYVVGSPSSAIVTVNDNEADTTPPTLNTAAVNGDMLTLTYDEVLDTASTPAATTFTLGGTSETVSTVAVSGMAVTLTLSAPLTSGDTVTVTYALPGSNPVQDAAGNDAAALTTQAVTNNTPPMLVRIGGGREPLVTGNELRLPYDDALNGSSVPDAGDFMLGGTSVSVSTVAVSGMDVVLTLSAVVSSTDVVTVTYVVPGTNPLQNAAGINAVAFTDESVRNVTPPVPTGVVTSSNAVGELEVSWTEPDPLGSAGRYHVQYRIDGGSNWLPTTPEEEPVVTAGATVTHTFTGLAAGMYHARVRSRASGDIFSAWVETGSAVQVNGPLALPAPANLVYTVNVAIDPPVTLPAATGGTGTISYTLTGPNGTDLSEVPGLAFNANTRVLSGTPTMSGTTTLTYTATDSATPTPAVVTQAFTITVSAVLTLPALSNLVYSVGTAIDPPVTLAAATGGVGAISYALTGTLPAGLAFNANTRQLSGTPTTPTPAGSPPTLTYTATDSATPAVTVTQTFTITVNTRVVLPKPDNLVYTAGTAIAPLTLPAATGGTGTFGYALNGALPAGLAYSGDGVLSGTPTTVGGPTTLTYVAVERGAHINTVATQTFTITINAALALTVPTAQSYGVGTAIAPLTLPAATGGTTPVSYTLTGPSAGPLPAGLVFNATTRVLSGTPTAIGTTELTYTATDSATTPVEVMRTFDVTVLPVVTITQDSSPVTEGTDATFTVTASPAPGAALTVNVSVTDSGSFISGPVPTTVMIPMGSTSATLTVATEDDRTDEMNGAITAEVTTGADYTVGAPPSAMVTVNDDDEPTVSISAGGAVTEGTAATFTLTADITPASDLTVNVSVSDSGSFISGAVPTTVMIPMGDTSATLTVATEDDNTDEANGMVTAEVTTGSGYTVGAPSSVMVVVNDNDEPTVSISAGGAVTEGTAATFMVTADIMPVSDLAVNVSVSDSGSFISGTAPTTVMIPAGDTSATLTVATEDDSTDEGSGSITATLASGTGYIVGSPSSAVVTVNDNDGVVEPAVSISAVTSPVTEGTDATFTVMASTPPASALTVNVSVTQTGMFIMGTAPTTVEIPAGMTSAPLMVATENDNTAEMNGSIEVTVMGGTGYTVGSPDRAVVTVEDNDMAGITVTPTSGLTTTEAGRTATFTVVLDSQPTADVSIVVSSSDTGEGTVSPTPCLCRTLTFTNSDWDRARTVTVMGVDDTVADGDQTYTIELAAATSTDPNYDGLNPADVSVINTDNDVVSTGITLTVQPNTLGEGGSATDVTVTATLNGSPVPTATTVTLSLGGVAVNGTDYSATAPTITIAARAAAGTATFSITPTDDAEVEGAETIVVSGMATGGFSGTVTPVTVTLTDNDAAALPAVSISAVNASVAEGADATFTVTAATAPASDVTVNVNVVDNGAFASAGDTGARTVTIVMGTTTATLTVSTVDDSVDEANATIMATVTTGSGYVVGALSSASVTVTDDDGHGITVTPTSGLTTTEVGGTATFTVVLATQPTMDVEIGVSSSNTGEGTVSPDTLTFTNADWNNAKTVTVMGVDDNVDDGNQMYTIELAAATSMDGNYNNLDPVDVSVSNTDDDAAPTSITLTVQPNTLGEGAGATDVMVTATLDGGTTVSAATTVTLSLGGTATGSGTDYSATAPTITIAAEAATGTATLRITPTNDDVVEGDEDIVVSGTATGGFTGTVNSATVTLTDNDMVVLPSVSISAVNASVAEGADATFTVTVTTAPASDVTVNVNIVDNGTFASSSDTGARTVTITMGTTTATLTVSTVDDSVDEANGTITATVTTGSGYVVGALSSASVTVTDDDGHGITVTPTSGLTTTESGGAATFTVVLDTQPTGDVSIGVSSSNTGEGTVSTGTLTFTDTSWNNAQTVTVTGVDDAVFDGSQMYTIELAAATSMDGNYNNLDPVDVNVSNTDDDAAPTSITLTVQPSSLSEGDSATDVTVTATFDGGTTVSAATTVTLSLGGTADSGTDYSATAPTITIAAGAATGTATFSITPIEDALGEGDENIEVSGTATGGFPGTVNSATVTLTDNDADMTAPTFVSAEVNGNRLVLTYSEALDGGSVPATMAFTLGGTSASVNTVAISGTMVTLSLSAAVASTDVVTVTYTVPDTSPLQDVAGNDAVALSMRSVTNNTPAGADADGAGADGARAGGAGGDAYQYAGGDRAADGGLGGGRAQHPLPAARDGYRASAIPDAGRQGGGPRRPACGWRAAGGGGIAGLAQRYAGRPDE